MNKIIKFIISPSPTRTHVQTLAHKTNTDFNRLHCKIPSRNYEFLMCVIYSSITHIDKISIYIFTNLVHGKSYYYVRSTECSFNE